jgi:hypothetical protein
MADTNDIQKTSVDEEWSKILGQTDAFLGHVLTLTQKSSTAEIPTPTPEEPSEATSAEDDDTAFVSAFPRSSQRIAVSFHIEGRAISRARAAYQELTGFRLRIITLSSPTPEVAFDEPIALPGKVELEIELPRRAAFVLVAVGVLDGRGDFRPLAHASPVALSPAMSYPKDPTPPVFINTQNAAPIRPPEVPPLPPLDDPSTENLSSWS